MRRRSIEGFLYDGRRMYCDWDEEIEATRLDWGGLPSEDHSHLDDPPIEDGLSQIEYIDRLRQEVLRIDVTYKRKSPEEGK